MTEINTSGIMHEEESDCRLNYNNRIELAISITRCSPCVCMCEKENEIEPAGPVQFFIVIHLNTVLCILLKCLTQVPCCHLTSRRKAYAGFIIK